MQLLIAFGVCTAIAALIVCLINLGYWSAHPFVGGGKTALEVSKDPETPRIATGIADLIRNWSAPLFAMALIPVLGFSVSLILLKSPLRFPIASCFLFPLLALWPLSIFYVYVVPIPLMLALGLAYAAIKLRQKRDLLFAIGSILTNALLVWVCVLYFQAWFGVFGD